VTAYSRLLGGAAPCSDGLAERPDRAAARAFTPCSRTAAEPICHRPRWYRRRISCRTPPRRARSRRALALREGRPPRITSTARSHRQPRLGDAGPTVGRARQRGRDGRDRGGPRRSGHGCRHGGAAKASGGSLASRRAPRSACAIGRPRLRAVGNSRDDAAPDDRHEADRARRPLGRAPHGLFD